jgi:hypothetical protein
MLYAFLQYPSKGSHLDLTTAGLMKTYCYYCMTMRWVQWIGSKTERDACMPATRPPPHTHTHTHMRTCTQVQQHGGMISPMFCVHKENRPKTETCTILGYYATSNGNSVLVFWDNVWVPPSGVKNPKWLQIGFQEVRWVSGKWNCVATDKAH